MSISTLGLAFVEPEILNTNDTVQHPVLQNHHDVTTSLFSQWQHSFQMKAVLPLA